MDLSVSANLASRQSFGLNINKPEIMANLSDKDIRDLAYKKTKKDVNESKHRAIQTAIYVGIPVVASLAAIARTPKFAIRTIGKHTKEVANGTRLAKLSVGLNNAFSWGAALLGGYAAYGATKLAADNSKSVRNFIAEHPFISTLVGLTAAYGGYRGIAKAGSKLFEKLASKAPQEAAKYALKIKGESGSGIKIGESALEYAKKLNDNKVLNAINKQINKIPSAIKDFTKLVLNIAPIGMLFGAWTNSTSHNVKKVATMYNNCEEFALKREAAREYLASQSADPSEE